MRTAAPSDANLTRQSALPQLGLPPQATAQEIEAAYSAAVAEIELMTRNARSEALSASYRRARDQIQKAYEVLKRSEPAGASPQGPVALHVNDLERGTSVEVSVNLADARPRSAASQGGSDRGSATAEPAAGKADATPSGGETTDALARSLNDEIVRTRQESARAREEAARARDEAARAREETARAREETATAQKVLVELRAQSQALVEDVARVRDRLKSLSDEAEAMRQTVGQLSAQTTRDMDAIAQITKRADGLLLSAQRNESEIATAAMHAEAYRDSAMYAAQMAERVLRALSAEATGT